jgi:hypothetical protein
VHASDSARPTMTLDTYAHVMAALDDADGRSAHAAILTARTSVVRVSNARVPEKEVSDDEIELEIADLRAISAKPSCGLEPQTPSLPS